LDRLDLLGENLTEPSVCYGVGASGINLAAYLKVTKLDWHVGEQRMANRIFKVNTADFFIASGRRNAQEQRDDSACSEHGGNAMFASPHFRTTFQSVDRNAGRA
jgi:hypothetical protein